MPTYAREAEFPAASNISDPLLARAGQYATRFERAFAAAIWSERYQQERRVRRRFNASGTSFPTLVGRRELDSELLFVWLPQDTTWIAVRDVIAVDGTPRAPGDRRLPALLSGPSLPLAQLKELAAENGRFNIGTIVRTFNEATLALLFLDEHSRRRFTFHRQGEETIGAPRAIAYDFVERATPTVIRSQNRDVKARGTLWLDAETGKVLRSVLKLDDARAGLRGHVTVQYGPHARFDVLVPLEMRESYVSTSGEEVTTIATFSDFRRFETGGRLIVR